jgi:hypothetical protein
MAWRKRAVQLARRRAKINLKVILAMRYYLLCSLTLCFGFVGGLCFAEEFVVITARIEAERCAEPLWGEGIKPELNFVLCNTLLKVMEPQKFAGHSLDVYPDPRMKKVLGKRGEIIQLKLVANDLKLLEQQTILHISAAKVELLKPVASPTGAPAYLP